VWSGGDMKEARSASGAITAQYFGKGQTINGSAYFYTKDRLASVREMTDTSGNVQSQYEYDPFGRVTKLQGNLTSDLQYAGYYCHLQSSLNLAVFRAYSSNLGRWINRDPISERGGINLYRYTKNDPIDISDPAGTAPAQVDPTVPRSPSDVSLPCPNGGENCGGLPGDPNRPDPNYPGYYLTIVPKNCFQDSVGRNHSVYFRTSNGYTYIYQPGSGPPLNTYPCTWCSNPPDTN
jgi:RHS repeat-associated protein